MNEWNPKQSSAGEAAQMYFIVHCSARPFTVLDSSKIKKMIHKQFSIGMNVPDISQLLKGLFYTRGTFVSFIAICVTMQRRFNDSILHSK